MRENFMIDAAPPAKIIFAIFIALITFLVTMLLGSLLAIPLFQVSLDEIPRVLTNYQSPENIVVLKYFQFIQTLGLFLAPAIICAYLFSGRGIKAYLKMEKTSSIEAYMMVLIIILISLPVINFLVEINSSIHFPEFMKPIEKWMLEKEKAARSITEAFVNVDTFTGLMGNLLIMAITPALAEEFIFRGVLQKHFAEWFGNVHWGIFASAFLFSLLHFQFYGLIPRLLLGAFFGYLIIWSGSIWLPVAAHFFNNALAVLVYFIFDEEFVSKNIDELGTTGNSIYLFFVGALLLAFLITLLYRKLKGIVPY